MKILWVVNVIIPQVAKDCGLDVSLGGGWVAGGAEYLLKKEDTELVFCFPNDDADLTGNVGNLKYYSFARGAFDRYSDGAEQRFFEIFNAENPEIIHIFGTEFSFSLAAVNAAERAGMLDRTVVGIQGIISEIAKYYFAGLPRSVINAFTLRDLLKKDNIAGQKKTFERRGAFEIEALKKVKNVIGRTDWDRECVKRINADARYYVCNETLRCEFYSGEWSFENCEKHSIFVGSCDYPVKGFHRLLLVLPELLKKYPDIKVYVTGESPLKATGFDSFKHRTYYQVYLKKLIKRGGLADKVIFTGGLSAENMKKRLLSSNLFLLCSSIENSPNTLGEAMILGVPCAASNVGGVTTMAEDGKDALIYPFDDNGKMKAQIEKIFDDAELAASLSENAKKRAQKTHSQETNRSRLLEIYREIISGEKEI